ncbi:cleavage stimulation factor subunit 3-like [Babylonia areolata]|uniref:cleavage stimulation factor subunit 3-like n=1 Tax=Babylonia areolata TaxID=304850 RepID=UPI003FD3A627
MAQPEDTGYIADKIVKAEKRIKASPYDTEAWSVLIRDAQMRKIEEGRTLFERLVEQFPSAGKYWKLYVEQELKAKNYERVEKLFQRCLIKVLNIDLWKLYLNYIKETKGKLTSYREKMAQAYDFALEKIGMDIMSYQIWVDYINFLKSVEAVGSYAENQRISAVRKVYQRGVTNPMINIEILWKDYFAYENSINALIAKKMTEDRGRDYMTARRVAKEYEAVTRGLDKSTPSVPPQNTFHETKQVELWKKYIKWEKSNPLRTEDQALITKRVMFAYEQCLLCLGHHPDVWFEAASYLEQSSRVLSEKGDQNAGKLFADEAAAIYERATTTIMKSNMLIYFAYADFEETRMKYDKVHQIYKRLVEREEVDPTLPFIQYMKFARRAEGIKSARLVFKLAREDKRTKYHVYVSAALMEYYCSKEKSIALKIFELGLKRYADVPEYALCYIEFMSHLNEDNNTRVLFERILSSGHVPPEKSTDIWSRFLAFESQVGDLASIVKVEKRRAQTIEKVQEYEGKETALLIDRYKYLDLLPCSDSELRAIGYMDLLRHNVVQLPAALAASSLLQNPIVDEEPEEAKRPRFVKPDFDQMLPFKPRAIVPPGSHPVPGGVFPPPPAAAALLQILPPPQCFAGPHVLMDKFMEHMLNLQLPSGPVGIPNGTDGQYRLDPGTQLSIDLATGNRKRRHTENEESDEEGADASSTAPVNDIYRARQQKKVK